MKDERNRVQNANGTFGKPMFRVRVRVTSCSRGAALPLSARLELRSC